MNKQETFIFRPKSGTLAVANFRDFTRGRESREKLVSKTCFLQNKMPLFIDRKRHLGIVKRVPYMGLKQYIYCW